MKLKNFIKKQKKELPKDKKAFHTNKKQSKKPSRANEKAKTKSNKRFKFLIIASGGIFLLVVLLSVIAYLYSSLILDKFQSREIVSPGEQFVFEVESAKSILSEMDIDVKSLEYSSSSGALTLVSDSQTTVYFSSKIDFSHQAEVLKKILNSLKSEDKSARVIDLRYNRPIVKF